MEMRGEAPTIAKAGFSTVDTTSKHTQHTHLPSTIYHLQFTKRKKCTPHQSIKSQNTHNYHNPYYFKNRRHLCAGTGDDKSKPGKKYLGTAGTRSQKQLEEAVLGHSSGEDPQEPQQE